MMWPSRGPIFTFAMLITAILGNHLPDLPPPDGCTPNLCPSEHTCPPSEIAITIPATVELAESASSCCPNYLCSACTEDQLSAKQCHCSTVTSASEEYADYADSVESDIKSNLTLEVSLDSYIVMGSDYYECRCFNEGYKWDWNMGCVCDVEKCRLPDLCLGNSVAVTVMEECCEVTECVECPEDSTATVSNDPEVEPKCVCRPCPDKNCSENEVTVIRKPGRNIPKHCCDLYDCIEKGCTVNGTKYDEAEQWTIETDTFCRCQNGIALCKREPTDTEEVKEELTTCFYNGNSYRHGDVWTVDQCTNCSCHAGQSKCIAHLCMQINETVCQTLDTSNCLLHCLEFDVDAQGCRRCNCKKELVSEDDSEKSEDDMDTTQKNYDFVNVSGSASGTENPTHVKDEFENGVKIVVIIVAAGVAAVICLYFLRKKCKRMRYYPEAKHNFLLDNNNTSRDIYTSTTKPDDQIIPLYDKVPSVECSRK